MFFINCSGCLGLIFIFFIMVFFLKLFGLALFILVILILYRPAFWNNLKSKIKSKNDKSYKPKFGEVYKICNCCQGNCPNNADRCGKCGKVFEN